MLTASRGGWAVEGDWGEGKGERKRENSYETSESRLTASLLKKIVLCLSTLFYIFHNLQITISFILSSLSFFFYQDFDLMCTFWFFHEQLCPPPPPPSFVAIRAVVLRLVCTFCTIIWPNVNANKCIEDHVHGRVYPYSHLVPVEPNSFASMESMFSM